MIDPTDAAITDESVLPTQEQVVDFSLPDRFVTLFWKAASYLTDPVCRAHEYWRRTFVVPAADSSPISTVTQHVKKSFLYMGIFSWGAVAAFASVPAIMLRYLAGRLQAKPFLHIQETVLPKELPENRAFTLFSWNICGPGAGYSISDGGVSPWRDRLDAVVDKIVEKDADINCLFEVFDIKAAAYIAERLREHGYVHFFYNMGPRAIGVNSGIFVASKYAIENAEFCPFPEESLVGRTKYAAKGVFSFDIVSKDRPLARIFATHLQHSELPAHATQEEIEARAYQLQLIVDKMQAVRGCCAILTGDLNFDPSVEQSDLWRLFDAGTVHGDTPSWGGDAYCANMVGKEVSGVLDLDHTVALKGSPVELVTELVPVDYDPNIYNSSALSDHAGKLSTIVV